MPAVGDSLHALARRGGHRVSKSGIREFVLASVGLLVLGFIGWGVYRLLCLFISLLSKANSTVAAAVVAGSLAVLSSTIAVVVGRNYEARRDREAAHRGRKTDTYDSFVNKLFAIFGGGLAIEETEGDAGLIAFFREINRKLLLWSGPGGLKAYCEWQDELRRHEGDPRAESVIKMVDFFLALRKDLGHSNRGLKRDHLVGLVLQNPQFFMKLYQRNPSISLAELAAAELMGAEEGDEL